MVVPAFSSLQTQTNFQLLLLSLLSHGREARAGNTVRLRLQAKLLVETCVRVACNAGVLFCLSAIAAILNVKSRGRLEKV